MPELRELLEHARSAEAEHLWNEAVRLHTQIAEIYISGNDCERAASHFMRAARFFEQSENWRDIGRLWLCTSRALEQARDQEKATELEEYVDYDSSSHFFLGITAEKWENLPIEERIARGYRYAAYHLEKDGSNQSSYNQYFKSGQTFASSGDWKEAARAFYLANINFIKKFGEVQKKYLLALYDAIHKGISHNKPEALHVARVYYRRIAAELRNQSNEEDYSTIVVKHRDITLQLSLINKTYLKACVYYFWKITSNYGTSFLRWLICAALLVVLIFPVLYCFFKTLTALPNSWFEMYSTMPSLCSMSEAMYFSIYVFVSSNLPDGFKLSSLGEWLVLVERLNSYFMLGSLLTLVANKLMR